MKEATKTTGDSKKEAQDAPSEVVLFGGGLQRDDYAYETLDEILQDMESVFTPSVFIGTLGLWDGRHNAYRFCHDFNEIRRIIGNYDDVIISQVGTRLHFTFIHHDGRNELELRRLTDYGHDNVDSMKYAALEDALEYSKTHSEDFGVITTS